jgi:hypothetical protein
MKFFIFICQKQRSKIHQNGNRSLNVKRRKKKKKEGHNIIFKNKKPEKTVAYVENGTFVGEMIKILGKKNSFFRNQI